MKTPTNTLQSRAAVAAITLILLLALSLSGKAADSSAKDILTFVFPGQAATTITGTNISVTVPYATDVTALAACRT